MPRPIEIACCPPGSKTKTALGAAPDSATQRAFLCPGLVRHATFRVEGQAKRGGVAGGSPDARHVLKALKVVDLRPPMPRRTWQIPSCSD